MLHAIGRIIEIARHMPSGLTCIIIFHTTTVSHEIGDAHRANSFETECRDQVPETRTQKKYDTSAATNNTRRRQLKPEGTQSTALWRRASGASEELAVRSG